MKEQLISFETAKLAKEKGFKIPSTNLYRRTILERFVDDDYNSTVDEFCTAPTQSLLQKWLREKHNIHVNCMYCKGDKIGTGYFYGIIESEKSENNKLYQTYEDALEQGLFEALKLIP